MHWCADETNALIAVIGSAGAVWMWLKTKVLAWWHGRPAPKQLTEPEACRCGHDHLEEELDTTPPVKEAHLTSGPPAA